MAAEARDENWYVETKKKIREAFQLFDKDRKGCVIQEEVSTIMRYLGAYPTERAMAFRVFDEDGKGYIEANRLREALITKGTPFREKEIDAFLSVAKDLETGHIYYEDYVALLTADTAE
ncbi:Ca2-binding protein [Aureococcus anophagefferens]|nr:Ca2-binding protein [Aureococcus anophagefferens]